MFKKLLPFILFLFSFNVTKAQNEFITTWKPGSTNQINFPGRGINFKVYWEEIGYPSHNGSINSITSTREFTINFGPSLNPNPSNATYRVKISNGNGIFNQVRSFDSTLVPSYNFTDRSKLLSITQWGNIKWQSFEQAFVLCSLLDITATDAPDLSLVTNMNEMFYVCTALVGNSSFNTWDTSSVTIMNNMFASADNFNQPIGNWNVSNVTQMYGLFDYAAKFNQPIGNWNTSNVTTMEHVFHGARSFNQDLRNWDTSKVTNMEEMFHYALQFNQSLGQWNLSSLLNAKDMFLNSGLNCKNYDNTLYGWSANAATPNNIDLSGSFPLVYSNPLAVNARNNLRNNKGWIIIGDTYNSECQSSLSTAENAGKNVISVFPNPATDFLYIKNLTEGNSNYKIIDNSGRILQQEILRDEKINVGTLTSGNYILQIISKDKIKTFKFIKK